MNQLQIPAGMRDVLPEDCLRKNMIRQKLMNVFYAYGYLPVETPLIEYYSTYKNTFDSIREEEMYKFMDDSGMILALRTDMTLPIARLCTTKLTGARPPFRFCYESNVYKVRQAFAGKRNEVTDCGVELIGPDSQSDPEVLCCALDALDALGIRNYTLEIGNSDFFKIGCEEAGLSSEDSQKLADLIDRKSMVDLQEMITALSLPQEISRFFLKLPLLNGPDALKEAAEVSFSPKLREVTDSLYDLAAKLKELEADRHVTFDLGKLPHLHYYTGIIFEGYIEGIGTSILSGGRYDTLLKKLGRDLPACGFGVKVDYLIEQLKAEPLRVKKVCYPAGKITDAIRLARKLQKEGPVELVVSEGKDVEVES